MKSILPVSAVVVGMVLLILGLSWSSLFPAAQGWTPEKSERLSKIGSETNLLQFQIVKAKKNPSMHSGQNPAELKAEFDKLMEEYDALNAEFESARDKPANTGSALKWVGIIVAAFGAVFVFLNKEA